MSTTPRVSEMSTPVRVVAFVAALAAVFAVAWGAGAVVGPIDAPAPTHQEMPRDH